MDGIQKTVALALRYVAQKVEDGAYGDDDEFAMTTEVQTAFLSDVEEATDKMY